MSRCFPFPPPGYEKKARLDDPDLLKKEKHREKNNKQKRSKDKKEHREKQEKDRSDEKRREKKEKKKKKRHRDKKKEKEKKDNNADKREIPSDPKGTLVQSHGNDEETSREKNSRDKEKDKCISLVGKQVSSSRNPFSGGLGVSDSTRPHPETKDVTFTQKSGSRTVGEEKRPVKPLLGADRRKDEEMVRLAGNFCSTTGDRNGRNKEKNVNGGRIDVGVVGKPIENAVVHSSVAFGQGKVEGMERHVAKNNDPRMDGEDKVGQNADRKLEKQKDKHKDKPRYEDKNREKDKKKEEKMKQKEDRHREHSGIKPSHQSPTEKFRIQGGSKSPVGLPRANETHESPIGQTRIKDISKSPMGQSKVKEAKLSDLLGFRSFSPQNLPQESSKISSQDGSLHKRKEVEPAKTVAEDDFGLNKKARTSFSLHFVQNGRSMELSKPSSAIALNQHQAPSHMKGERSLEVSETSNISGPDARGPNRVKAEIKEPKLNSAVDVWLSRRPSPSPLPIDQKKAAQVSRMPSAASAHADQKVEAQQLRQPSTAVAFVVQEAEANPLKTQSPVKANSTDQRAEARPLKRPSPTTIFEDQKAKVSRKPQHPDTKNMSQVLTVPRMGGLSEYSDQEWLFGRIAQSGNLKVVNPGDRDTPLVWAEAVKIESTDIIVLPFVIPY